MQKRCLICSNSFAKKPNESKKYWKTKRFCTRRCALDHEIIKADKALSIKICSECGSEYKKTKKLSRSQWEVQTFCSRTCAVKNPERNKKIGKVALGNTYSRGKIPWNKGTIGLQTMSEEAKKKLSDTHKKRVSQGLCHLWKGGITGLNKELRACKLMRDWKRSVLERDDFTCQKCGVRGGQLNADHVKEFSLIRKENNIKNYAEAEKCKELWDLDNGQTLCVECHKIKTSEFLKKNWSNQFNKKLKTATNTWQLI